MRRHFKICPRIYIQHCLLVGRGLLLYSHTGQGWWGHHHLDDALPETCAFFSSHCSACIFFWDNVCTSMRVSEKSMNKVYRDMTSCFAHPHPIVRSRSRSKESWAPYSALTFCDVLTWDNEWSFLLKWVGVGFLSLSTKWVLTNIYQKQRFQSKDPTCVPCHAIYLVVSRG